MIPKELYTPTMHLLEWPESTALMAQVLARMWSSKNTHMLSVRMQNGAATLEHSFAGSSKTTCTLTI